MEMAGKFPRIIRSGNGSTKVGRKREEQEEDERPGKRPSAALDIANSPGGLLCGWPSSRIVRVSRASGGKDRHSKVWTSKGLRDRRVRLSVNTAIQFYDLQDRLGYDQPSKAVEWLLKAAAASIDELPSINTSFPSTPGQQLSDEKRATEMEMAGELYQHHHQQQQQQQGNTFSKSACSSTSETSKGSGLSLSRCESRMKARERARGRAAEKEKEKEKPHQNVSQSSFTDLLTGNGNANTRPSPNRESPASSRQWCSAPMDYFAAGMLGLSSTPSSSANLLGQIHTPPLFNVPGEHYSFLPDHIASNGNGHGNDTGHDYNLNFSISPSGYAGFSRGTLQSNSSSLPRFPSSSSSLFTATAPPVEEDHHHHHFLPGFDARLQLCYGDGGSHSDQKGKVKN